MSQQDQLLKCESLSQRTKLVLSVVPPDLKQHEIQEENLMIIYNRCKFMIEYDFTREKLKSSIKLYKAESTSIRNMEDDYGFSELCATPVEVTTVKGGHETMLENDVLADDIMKFFNLNNS